jgi:hypothetical protein
VIDDQEAARGEADDDARGMLRERRFEPGIEDPRDDDGKLRSFSQHARIDQRALVAKQLVESARAKPLEDFAFARPIAEIDARAARSIAEGGDEARGRCEERNAAGELESTTLARAVAQGQSASKSISHLQLSASHHSDSSSSIVAAGRSSDLFWSWSMSRAYRFISRPDPFSSATCGSSTSAAAY